MSAAMLRKIGFVQYRVCSHYTRGLDRSYVYCCLTSQSLSVTYSKRTRSERMTKELSKEREAKDSATYNNTQQYTTPQHHNTTQQHTTHDTTAPQHDTTTHNTRHHSTTARHNNTQHTTPQHHSTTQQHTPHDTTAPQHDTTTHTTRHTYEKEKEEEKEKHCTSARAMIGVRRLSSSGRDQRERALCRSATLTAAKARTMKEMMKEKKKSKNARTHPGSKE